MSESNPNLLDGYTGIMINTKRGSFPFSVGYLGNSLQMIGLKQKDAREHALEIANIVNELNRDSIDSRELFAIGIEYFATVNVLYSKRLEIVAKDFEDIKPIVILLGGVTGIGKSTLAKMLAQTWEIKSILGTDLIREALRLVFSDEFMPTLHTSSYKAYTKISEAVLKSFSPTIVGFEEQAIKVMTGVEAAITQSMHTGEFQIIEGVHLIPGILKPEIIQLPFVIPILLSLEDEEIHLGRLKRREALQTRGTHYSKYFKEIREIQSYLLKQAEIYGIKIIDILDDEIALPELINFVWDVLKMEGYY